MRDTFADHLRDLRTEFESMTRPDKELLPEAVFCFDQAGKISNLLTRLGKLAVVANCRDRLDGPFCDQVWSLNDDLEEARKEILTVGIRMAKTTGYNHEVIERMVSDAGGNPLMVAQVEKIAEPV